MKSDIPTYNLKAVMRETGLSAGTLRAWERRYGLLQPLRTTGGHRLYTEQDIKLLKWLVARQDEGLSISHAITMWNNLEKAEQDQIQRPADARPMPAAEVSPATLNGLRRAWIEACLVFDEQAAEQMLAEAFAIASAEDVCIEILQKGLAEIGYGWYSGSISVQQEHFASALALRRLNALLTAASPPTRPGRILAALPPDEMHAFSLLMLSLLLRRRGFDVVYLGTNVPFSRLNETLALIKPRLILSAAQTLISAASLQALAAFASAQGLPLAFGGGIFVQIAGLAGRIPGHYLGSDLRTVTQQIERLLANPAPPPKVKPMPAETAALREKFAAAMTQIDATAARAMQSEGVELHLVETVQTQFSRQILAALTLGNIDYLDVFAGWLESFSQNHDLPPGLTARYYAAYRQGVQEHLGSDAGPILDWFAKMEDGD